VPLIVSPATSPVNVKVAGPLCNCAVMTIVTALPFSVASADACSPGRVAIPVYLSPDFSSFSVAASGPRKVVTDSSQVPDKSGPATCGPAENADPTVSAAVRKRGLIRYSLS
jgi:hypothetical protein